MCLVNPALLHSLSAECSRSYFKVLIAVYEYKHIASEERRARAPCGGQTSGIGRRGRTFRGIPNLEIPLIIGC